MRGMKLLEVFMLSAAFVFAAPADVLGKACFTADRPMGSLGGVSFGAGYGRDGITGGVGDAKGTEEAPWLIGKGTPGDVTAWTNATGRLVVEGDGAMMDFTGAAPWAGDVVTEAVVDANVTNIGANALAGCTALKALTLRGNPPALGAGNDLSGVERISVRKDAIAKFRAAPAWSACAAKFEARPVCYHGLRRLAPFLHEIWYDDYTFDRGGETLSNSPRFSCSSVRNGNFIGRNFDFFLNDRPEFVVHVAADPTKGRLASIAMATHTGFSEDGVMNGLYTASYDLIPNRTLDGINEKGVAINENVVAYDKEVVAGPGREFTGTNPSGEPLNISFVPRFVLDHATNAAHAVELIRSRNLYGISVSGDILHYMVSDPRETYVVEIITNTVVARHMKIMTNFCLNWNNGKQCAIDDSNSSGWLAADYPAPVELVAQTGSSEALKGYYAPHAEGVERFMRLRDNYDEGATFDGMVALMRRVQFSQYASFETQPFWYSDRCSIEADQPFEETGVAMANIYALYEPAYRDFADWYLEENIMRDERTYLAEKEKYRKCNTGVWLTVHNTTYDIEKRMFRVVVQEDYAHPFDIWLEPPAPYDVGDYVQDGLVAQYDGIRNVGATLPHDGTAQYWENLASPSNTLAFGGSNPASGSWTPNGYAFTGASFAQMTNAVALGNAFTIEVVLTADPNANAATYPNWVDGHADYGIFTRVGARTTLEWKSDGWTGDERDNRPKLANWAGDYLVAVLTSTNAYLTSGTTYQNAKGVRFACDHATAQWAFGGGANTDKWSTRYAVGTYHAIRLYNRPLTEAELAHNRAIDEARFRQTASDVIVVVEDGKTMKIPTSWFETGKIGARRVFDPAMFAARFGTHWQTAALMPTGKRDAAGRDLLVWQDYIAGTDPMDSDSVLRADIAIRDDEVYVGWTPNLNDDTENLRLYKVWGRQELGEGGWKWPAAAKDRFFKVEVSLPTGEISDRIGTPIGGR